MDHGRACAEVEAKNPRIVELNALGALLPSVLMTLLRGTSLSGLLKTSKSCKRFFQQVIILE